MKYVFFKNPKNNSECLAEYLAHRITILPMISVKLFDLYISKR